MESNKHLLISFARSWCYSGAGALFALVTAIGIIETLSKESSIDKSLFEKIVGRISFFR